MGNVEGWGGPLPNPSWYAAQQTLQQQILFQMRRFGMVPVLPGFAGHVPKAIVKLYPTAKISELSAWGHFSPPYCCTYFLDPQDPLFQVSLTAVNFRCNLPVHQSFFPVIIFRFMESTIVLNIREVLLLRLFAVFN